MEMGKWKKNIHLHNRKSEDEVWDWYIFLRNWIFKNMYRKISSVQFSRSVVSNSLWPHELQHARSPCPSPTPGVEFTKLMSIESVMPSNHLTLCWPFLLLPSIFPSIRVFSNESALHIRWPKYWSFSFNINPSNEYSGLISPLGWTGWISLQSKGLSRVFSNTTVQKHQFFDAYLSLYRKIKESKIIVLGKWDWCVRGVVPGVF